MKTNSPTNSHRYNCVLASWNADPRRDASKGPTLPQCEECNADLTGKDVIECPDHWEACAGWVCVACAKSLAAGRDEDGEDDRPDRSNQLRYVGGGYAMDSRGGYREAFWAGQP